MLVGVLFLFTLFGEGCGNVMNDDHAIKSVLQEIRSLKEKVSSLEERLTKSEQENELLRKHQRELQRNTRQEETTFPELEIAFSASVSSHVKNMTAHQGIVFGTTRTNIGDYYNNTTGVFYVPLPGTYMFYVNILSESGNSIETELVVNGKAIAEIYSGAGRFHGAGSNMVIVRLDHGDNVWVKVHAAYSTDMSVHCCWSTFSGYLLREVYSPSAGVIG